MNEPEAPSIDLRTARPVDSHAIPEDFVNQLVKAGQIPVSMVRGIPMEKRLGERCLCRHFRGAHPADGMCRAKGCTKFPGGCQAFVQDPEAVIPPGTMRKVRIKRT